jgi:hypothetical protein
MKSNLLIILLLIIIIFLLWSRSSGYSGSGTPWSDSLFSTSMTTNNCDLILAQLNGLPSYPYINNFLTSSNTTYGTSFVPYTNEAQVAAMFNTADANGETNLTITDKAVLRYISQIGYYAFTQCGHGQIPAYTPGADGRIQWTADVLGQVNSITLNQNMKYCFKFFKALISGGSNDATTINQVNAILPAGTTPFLIEYNVVIDFQNRIAGVFTSTAAPDSAAVWFIKYVYIGPLYIYWKAINKWKLDPSISFTVSSASASGSSAPSVSCSIVPYDKYLLNPGVDCTLGSKCINDWGAGDPKRWAMDNYYYMDWKDSTNCIISMQGPKTVGPYAFISGSTAHGGDTVKIDIWVQTYGLHNNSAGNSATGVHMFGPLTAYDCQLMYDPNIFTTPTLTASIVGNSYTIYSTATSFNTSLIGGRSITSAVLSFDGLWANNALPVRDTCGFFKFVTLTMNVLPNAQVGDTKLLLWSNQMVSAAGNTFYFPDKTKRSTDFPQTLNDARIIPVTDQTGSHAGPGVITIASLAGVTSYVPNIIPIVGEFGEWHPIINLTDTPNPPWTSIPVYDTCNVYDAACTVSGPLCIETWSHNPKFKPGSPFNFYTDWLNPTVCSMSYQGPEWVGVYAFLPTGPVGRGNTVNIDIWIQTYGKAANKGFYRNKDLTSKLFTMISYQAAVIYDSAVFTVPTISGIINGKSYTSSIVSNATSFTAGITGGGSASYGRLTWVIAGLLNLADLGPGVSGINMGDLAGWYRLATLTMNVLPTAPLGNTKIKLWSTQVVGPGNQEWWNLAGTRAANASGPLDEDKDMLMPVNDILGQRAGPGVIQIVAAPTGTQNVSLLFTEWRPTLSSLDDKGKFNAQTVTLDPPYVSIP